MVLAHFLAERGELLPCDDAVTILVELRKEVSPALFADGSFRADSFGHAVEDPRVSVKHRPLLPGDAARLLGIQPREGIHPLLVRDFLLPAYVEHPEHSVHGNASVALRWCHSWRAARAIRVATRGLR